jgi:hypothetical protein
MRVNGTDLRECLQHFVIALRHTHPKGGSAGSKRDEELEPGEKPGDTHF